MRWEVPAELTERERAVVKRLRRGSKFYVFLREIRAELFDDAFQAELAAAGYGTPRGQQPLPPAMLAMATLMQAYLGLSDVDAVETAEADMRWQLVLGTLGQEVSPFGQGSLVRFRERMAMHDLDRRLVDRTVELAKQSGGFGWQALRAAFDSSPLLGAGRVEDTWNLIGHAMRKLLDCVAKVVQVPAEEIVREAGLTVLGGPSIKASLDLDWDDPTARQRGLERLLNEAESLQTWVLARAGEASEKPPLDQALADLERVVGQDLEPDPNGGGKRIVRGTARDRMPSLGDREMRHGRKSKSKTFNGYKRHIAKAMGSDIILGAVVLPANVPEHQATEALRRDAERHGELAELAIDRGYLGSPVITDLLNRGAKIRCKPWPSRNAGRFTKEDFAIDPEARSVLCPAGKTAYAGAGNVAHFGQACATCRLRQRCTTAEVGRSVTLHPQEGLLIELRQARRTPEGRAVLRQRTTVEHGLARIGAIQGNRARYKGVRKNTLDVRRAAALSNLMTVQRMREAA